MNPLTFNRYPLKDKINPEIVTQNISELKSNDLVYNQLINR
ncbi:hypothetical protein BACUNI_00091 [Bacteroides uniformis ATCC 8492]|uniref:Uncharacterized protein n=1 Tax=Bacteroides uniformis (strain ATCC 8492 / DSM 6597 / CCUG 4942 / CIP 103695 / JCM 5828 / KCTC 5204 / NCTC 13054 / VPI 0061) TaxID=411479 RepID=A0ABC9NHT6_BACUC|nr:hypothetical protein BACUNI_00091 [Bacteroides uniformis ATCC 8492]